MAKLSNPFDATTIDPIQAFDVIPPGKYIVQIVESEMRLTKDGRGEYLWLQLDILEGEYAGRKLFERLNLINDNPKTVEIAQRTLSAICRAVGKMHVSDSQELHLIPFCAHVRVKKSDNGYEPQNVMRYSPLEGNTTPVTAPSPPKQTTQAKTPPWKR